MASDALTVASLLEREDLRFFPAAVTVVNNGGSSVPNGSRLVLLFVESHRAVRFRDSQEQLFSEMASFSGCYFERLPDNPQLDDKMFLTACHVLEKPTHLRPKKVMATMGYYGDVSGTSEFIKNDVFAVTGNQCEVNGERCVMWDRLDPQGKVTGTVCVPVNTKALFITKTDPNKYSLAEVTENVKHGRWKLPVRLQTCTPPDSSISSIKPDQKLTALTLSRKQFLVAAFGQELLRLPEDSSVMLKWLDDDSDEAVHLTSISSALNILSRYVDTSRTRLLGSFVVGSLSWQESYKPELPPRRSSTSAALSFHSNWSAENATFSPPKLGKASTADQEVGYEPMELKAVSKVKEFIAASSRQSYPRKPKVAPKVSPRHVQRSTSLGSMTTIADEVSHCVTNKVSPMHQRRATTSGAIPIEHIGPHQAQHTEQLADNTFPRQSSCSHDQGWESDTFESSGESAELLKSPPEGYIQFKRSSKSRSLTYDTIELDGDPSLQGHLDGRDTSRLQLEVDSLRRERDALKKKLKETETLCAGFRAKVAEVRRILA